jgi:hypothetical protein
MKNAVLIQHAYGHYFTEDYRPMIELVRERHQAYADKWQMDYLVAFGAVKTEWKADNGGWAKLELVRLMLEKGYEYVFFMDADAMIIDLNTDLRDGCPDGLGMVVHNGPGTPGPHMNVGIMFVKNSERVRALFVEWASRYPGTTTFPWYEQGEAHKMRSEDKWKDIIIEIPAKWNSCLAASNHVNDAVIEGWHGMGNGVQRYQQMKAYLEILKQKETESDERQPPANGGEVNVKEIDNG